MEFEMRNLKHSTEDVSNFLFFISYLKLDSFESLEPALGQFVFAGLFVVVV